MANNGRLVPHEQGYRGVIATMALKVDVELVRNPLHKPDDRDSPKYEIVHPATGAKIGAAWERVMERGDNRGEKMLSLTIDDPSLEKPLHVAAFPREGGAFEVTWTRHRGPVNVTGTDPGKPEWAVRP